MKLFVFWGLIVVSIYGSLTLGLNDIKNNKKPMNAIIKAILVNVIILGIGSVWWILTESDGISQGIGVMIYLGSIVVISLIDTIVIYIGRKSKKQVS
ncbi:hypothetical protein [Clostridium sp.]|jgi:hypothetical protein|uniref:hypothetical protein n=1 Tax=Clostridium sp. TaxID=1506 RepID=UPI003EEE5832